MSNVFLPSLAYFLIGFYFVFYGFWNIYHWIPLVRMMSEKGIPHAYFFLAIGIVLQTVAGYLIMFGIYSQIAALLLIPFTLFSVLLFHPFWKHKGELRVLNFSVFFVNSTVTIAALILLILPHVNAC